MTRIMIAVATSGLVAACSNPHDFEVKVTDREFRNAELELYGVTTPMTRTPAGFVARRENRSDGDGRIMIISADGRQIECPIGYVTSRDPEPHRFVVEGDACRAI